MTDQSQKSPAKKDDKSNYAIGGGFMLGLGAGFFVLESSALYFVGCLIGGIGIGLVVAAFLTKR